MARAKEEYDVTVLSRDDVVTYPKLNQPVTTKIITYVAAGLPPHSINVLKAEWTLQKEKLLIRKDLQERLKKQPEAYKV